MFRWEGRYRNSPCPEWKFNFLYYCLTHSRGGKWVLDSPDSSCLIHLLSLPRRCSRLFKLEERQFQKDRLWGHLSIIKALCAYSCVCVCDAYVGAGEAGFLSLPLPLPPSLPPQGLSPRPVLTNPIRLGPMSQGLHAHHHAQLFMWFLGTKLRPLRLCDHLLRPSGVQILQFFVTVCILNVSQPTSSGLNTISFSIQGPCHGVTSLLPRLISAKGCKIPWSKFSQHSPK